MYIWTAIDVDSQLSLLKRKVKEVTRSLNSLNSVLTLPLHISLRISFLADDLRDEEIMEYITQYYQSLSPFVVQVQEMENIGNTIWISIKSNPKLQKIHNHFIDSLSEKYDIGTHEFDSYFAYHVSLFMDDNPSKVSEAYSSLSSELVPTIMAANRFVIGISESGKAGDYRVVREIVLI